MSIAADLYLLPFARREATYEARREALRVQRLVAAGRSHGYHEAHANVCAISGDSPAEQALAAELAGRAAGRLVRLLYIDAPPAGYEHEVRS